jgi:hypothetical protein
LSGKGEIYKTVSGKGLFLNNGTTRHLYQKVTADELILDYHTTLVRRKIAFTLNQRSNSSLMMKCEGVDSKIALININTAYLGEASVILAWSRVVLV